MAARFPPLLLQLCNSPCVTCVGWDALKDGSPCIVIYNSEVFSLLCRSKRGVWLRNFRLYGFTSHLKRGKQMCQGAQYQRSHPLFTPHTTEWEARNLRQAVQLGRSAAAGVTTSTAAAAAAAPAPAAPCRPPIWVVPTPLDTPSLHPPDLSFVAMLATAGVSSHGDDHHQQKMHLNLQQHSQGHHPPPPATAVTTNTTTLETDKSTPPPAPSLRPCRCSFDALMHTVLDMEERLLLQPLTLETLAWSPARAPEPPMDAFEAMAASITFTMERDIVGERSGGGGGGGGGWFEDPLGMWEQLESRFTAAASCVLI